MNRFRSACSLLIFSLLVSSNLLLHSQRSSTERASCRKFVQNFYDWYAAMDARNEKTNEARTTTDIALRLRPGVFDEKLVGLLRADSEAQAKADELVGLDFDPFFNSQDPSPHFEVASAAYSNGACDATVYGMRDGRKQEQVYPRLKRVGDTWKFVDFFYEKGPSSHDQDLLSILKDLATARKSDSR